MDFWKSVFSSDPDPSASSTEGNSPSDSPQKPKEVEDDADAKDSNPSLNSDPQNSPWVGLGSLIKNFASKSESVIQTYRRDLEEFGSGLKKETVVFRDIASRAVRDLPSSLEAGASAAQDSLETVGQAIDDLGGSVWRGTAEIISQGKEALLVPDYDADAYTSVFQTPSSGGVTASTSKRYSRFDVQVLAIQSDPSTFTEEPEDSEDFIKWKSEFKLEGKEEEIETLCYDNGSLESLFEKMVPSSMDYDTFWNRYFYKLYKLKQAEDARASLVKRVISREDEDLTWEVDDDEEVDTEKEVELLRSETTEEGGEKRDMVDEAMVDHVEELEEKLARESIESDDGKIPAEMPKVKSSVVAAIVDSDMPTLAVEMKDDAGKTCNELISNSDEKVLPDAKSVLIESCRDSDISVVSSQPSILEEEDLGWDEIEDLGDQDEKKVAGSNPSPNREDIRRRIGVVEDDEDLNWDIEDDD
ncbi:hypothetical protein HPP92_024948 [Vanilla planifolia]|uniref:BSD domain-containing protein n=1 Tax=Vanilla planifolia TaxID=51239 RepID=A0A835PKX4_VANPL|nr:hypothetical protein HPP92_024948 [Vanilla planifolia]